MTSGIIAFAFSSFLLVDLGENFAVTEQLVFLLTGLDSRATKRRKQNTVTDGHAHGDALAIAVQTTGSDGQDLGLVELLDARLGQEDAAGGLGLGLDALDKHAVQEGSEVADGSDGRHCEWMGR